MEGLDRRRCRVDEIRSGLRAEAHGWLEALNAPRELGPVELTGMIPSVAHLAYHLGAIRQINKSLRGPKEGTFTPESGAPQHLITILECEFPVSAA